MNIVKLITTVAAFVTAGTVFAQEYVQPDAGFVSAKSRLEVKAEFARARSDHPTQAVDSAYPVVAIALKKSRSDVVAELEKARSDGSLRGADHEYPIVQASGLSKTRGEVRAELAAVISSGAAFKPTNH